MPYLVDGNNLAHALGLSRGNLADRTACARTVASFCDRAGAQAVVVFDGPPSEDDPRTAGSKVRLVFSGSRSADEVVLSLLKGSKTPRDFTVVTSDKSLGDKSRHRGALVERTHEFSKRLTRPPRSPSGSTEKPTRETKAEIDAWLAVFDPSRE